MAWSKRKACSKECIGKTAGGEESARECGHKYDDICLERVEGFVVDPDARCDCRCHAEDFRGWENEPDADEPAWGPRAEPAP